MEKTKHYKILQETGSRFYRSRSLKNEQNYKKKKLEVNHHHLQTRISLAQIVNISIREAAEGQKISYRVQVPGIDLSFTTTNVRALFEQLFTNG